MTRPHSHPCDRCRQPVPCDAPLERNYDGFPEVICPAYHRSGGVTAPVQCEACAEHPNEDADDAEACDGYRCTGRTPGPTD